MILWFGWYGFNPGSTLGMGNTGLVGLVVLNTTLAAGAGALAAMLLIYFRTGQWDLTFTLNGSLAGLVAVTAGCAFVVPWAAVVIGLIAGVLVIYAVEFVEMIKIDDPVGAFSVHAACGIWGTIAIGLLGEPALTFGSAASKGGLLMGGGTGLLVTQAIGSLATIAFIAGTSVIMFGALKMFRRLRVDPVGDMAGIDAYEHGVSLWPDVLPMPSVTYLGKSEERAAPVRKPASMVSTASD
jgi:Amt family ammonium transporter